MKTGPNPKCMTDLRCRPALWVNLMALAYHPRQLSARECRCYHDFREMGTRPKFVRFGEAVPIPAGKAFFARFDSTPRPSRPNNQRLDCLCLPGDHPGGPLTGGKMRRTGRV